MGLFEKIFGRPAPPRDSGYFQTLTAYQPVFRTWGGALYESELCRAAIDARARHISKLKVEIIGSAKPKLSGRLAKGPNSWQTWGQFLYRLSTILDMQNTAFIVPVFGEIGEVSGFYPILPSACSVVQVNGAPWLRYQFSNGQLGAVALSECGVMTKFQYRDDFFGENNHALTNTMNLLEMQGQGIQAGIENSATYRFMARVNNFARPEDLAKERTRFNAQNLQSGDGGGLLLFPNTYSDIQQIKSSPYVVDYNMTQQIKQNVFEYFGVNEDILQNKAYGDAWSAFYEGAIETFSIQFSDVMTKAIYSDREQIAGAKLQATANRLQYMSNADKLNVSAQMADRGLMSINEIREIWNLPPVDFGDIRIMRGEYKASDDVEEQKDE